ncbi:MAG: Fic family protein [Saprospiraceae bacterium]|nr:Fic family protein [Lewinellaceae bacterium]
MNSFQAGTFRLNTGYQAFFPEKINRSYAFDDSAMLPLLEKANLKMGELNTWSELAPDIGQFIRLFVVKEATLSSRIEGTQTSVEEALLNAEDIAPERRDDWQEVNNYIEAMNVCLRLLPSLPLSSRMIKKAHAVLLQGVRGERKAPGEFRRSQNWIGGATPMDAAFVPPPWTEIEALMGDLENFLHSENTQLPHLLKIALAHYQFETIHPFLDGNGRIGRLMIPLYLISVSMLQQPAFYISDFIERNKVHYYDHLTRVRMQNDIRPWFRFFLVGTIETCETAIVALRSITDLKKDCETKRLTTLGRRLPNARLLLDRLFSNPIIRADEVAAHAGVSLVSSYKLIDDFVRLGILQEQTGYRRNRVFVFREYLNLFER